MKKWIISVIFACLAIATVAFSEYFPDVIVTSPNGLWTDTRAYTSINSALTAIGANERDVYIVRSETVAALTVPANVSLHFLATGAIANTGQLLFQTTDIHAANRRQIFKGVGDIDFAQGTVVRSGWFSDLVTAFNITADDYITLVISKPDNITANCSVGNDVQLKWESPRNRITANIGFELSNIGQIEAGDYQLFVGAGDFDFRDGTSLNIKWFARLRSVLTWVESEQVTLIIAGTNTVDYSDTVPENINFDFTSRKGKLSFSPLVTLDLSGKIVPLSGFDSLSALVTAAPTSTLGLVIDKSEAPVASVVVPSTYITAFDPGMRINPPAGVTVTFSPNTVIAGPTQHIFGGLGDITLGGKIYLEWFGAVADAMDGSVVGATDNSAAFDRAVQAIWRGGGGELAANGTGTYRDNIAWSGGAYYTSTALISVDTTVAGGLPDGTTWAAATDIKPITFSGRGSSTSIIVTDAAVTLFYFNGTTGSIHGKYHWKDLAIIGTDLVNATSIGIDWASRMIRGNSVTNLYIGGFYDSFKIGSVSGCYNNVVDNLIISYPGNIGLSVENSEDHVFTGLQVRNGANLGLYVRNCSALTFVKPTINYHLVTQVRLAGSASHVTFEEMYIEPGYGEAANRNIIELLPTDLRMHLITFRNIRFNAGRFSTNPPNHYAANVNVFWISNSGGVGTGYLEGLKIDGINLPSYKSYATGTVYVVNNDAANRVTIAGAEYTRQSVAAAALAYDGIFDSVTTEREFNLIQDDQVAYTRIKGFASTATYTFAREDMVDDAANSLYMAYGAAAAITVSSALDLPYGASLVAVSYRHNYTVGAGTLTISEDSLTGGFSIVLGSSTVQHTVRYPIGQHVIAYNTSFDPKVTTATLGAATYDIVLVFHFVILIDEQDRTS